MSQPGFFDLSRRYESLDAKPDPLLALNRLIPWETFRPKLRSALEETGQRMTSGSAQEPGWPQAVGRGPDVHRCFSRSTTSRTTMWNI